MKSLFANFRDDPLATLHLSRLSTFVAALALWCLPAHAQLERATQSIDIAASTGFQQQVQLDKWTPVTITLRNAGAAATGYLEILVADSRDRLETRTHYRQPFELTRGAQKRFQFTIFISRISQPLSIRVVTDTGEVVSSSVDLRSKLTRQRFIAVSYTHLTLPTIYSV